MTSERVSYQLADVIDLIGGGTPKTSVPEYWDGDIPWLSVKDFNNDDRYVYATEKSITQAGLDNSSTKMLAYDDIIISARGTIGELAMIPFPMAFNQSCYGIRGKKGLVIQPYLYYLLKDSIRLLKSQTHGSVFDTITRDTFASVEVSLPSVDEQQKIADTLTSLDDRIATNKAINNHLEQMAQAIFKSWFVDFDPFADGEFTESELGTIPAGWQVDRIGDLPVTVTDYVANGSFASLKENVTLLESPDYAVFVRNVDLKAGSFGKFVDEHSYHFLSKSALFGGEVIISNVGDVGSVFLCPYLSQPMTLGNNMIMLTANERKEYNYFFYLLFKHSYGAELIRSITGGSAQPKFNKTDFRSLRVVMPPFEVMDKFLETVECLFERQSELEQEITRLAELRDTLLPRLISGELSVCDVDAK